MTKDGHTRQIPSIRSHILTNTSWNMANRDFTWRNENISLISIHFLIQNYTQKEIIIVDHYSKENKVPYTKKAARGMDLTHKKSTKMPHIWQKGKFGGSLLRIDRQWSNNTLFWDDFYKYIFFCDPFSSIQLRKVPFL